MLSHRLVAPLFALALLAALIAPATAQVLPAGERIVAEPSARQLYIGFDEYLDLLEEMEERYGDLITVGSMGESEEGRPLIEVELTDPESDIAYDDRGVVFLSQGIHANEPGGREGMIRVIEDLLIAATDDAHTDHDATIEMLGKLRIVQVVTNVDGWRSGDLTSGQLPRYTRENAEGVDLNRQLPWPGYVNPSRDYTEHAEARAMVADADERREEGQRVVATGDVHGMIQDESAVWTMLSSGQFDLGGWVRQLEMGRAIAAEVEAELDGTAVGFLETFTAGNVTPHRLTTSSEFQGGLSGSGFYGDFLARPDGLDSPSVSTIELFFNNTPAGTGNQGLYNPQLVQIHVDSVRAIVRGMLEAAVTEYEVAVELAGTVGYVFDPAEVTVDEADLRELRSPQTTVTPMRFFDDLDPYLSEPLIRIETDELAAAGILDDLDVLVLTSAVAIDDADAMAEVAAFADAGGTVVLTDAALQALPRLDDRFSDDEVDGVATMIGNVSFTDFDHAMSEGVRDSQYEEALHTYEPATLGYNTDSGGGEAPVWRVDRDAWEAAGGDTVATTGGETSIGELTRDGAGTIRIIGGLLPLPTTRPDADADTVLYGLYSYAPTDTGYFVFLNALDGAIGTDPVPAQFPEPGEDPTEEPTEPPAHERIVRLSGAGRIDTAIAVSEEIFSEADAVVLARAGDYPDALAGAPLARRLDAPMLLTDGDSLSPRTLAEIERLGAETAVLLGGTAALSEQVAQELEDAGVVVDRIDGATRFATAAAIADRFGPSVPTAFLAAGGPPPDAPDPAAAGWPDAVAVASYAAYAEAPILLAMRDDLPAETEQALRRLGVTETVIVGGTAAVGDEVEEQVRADGHGPRRLAGPTRYGTSRAIAEEGVSEGMRVSMIWLATGRAFPDALGAGPAAAAGGDSLVLVDPLDLESSPETGTLTGPVTRRVYILGGTAAISAHVEQQVAERLGEE
jgi:putative cell wall-binding protein